MKIGHAKNFWGGVLFAVIGGMFAVIAKGIPGLSFLPGYAMGTPARMGPAFFPFWLGLILFFIGLSIAIMGLREQGGPGLFASGKRREDYRLRQSNAAAAQAELAKLEQLSGAIGAVTTPAAADSAIKQAKAIQAKLHDLQTSSAAAMPGTDDAKQQ